MSRTTYKAPVMKAVRLSSERTVCEPYSGEDLNDYNIGERSSGWDDFD